MPIPTDIVLQDLTFYYEGAESPLFRHLSLSFRPGFTGIIGANGAGKTTLLRLVSGQLKPTGGAILGGQNTVYCEQRTDEPPVALPEFLEDYTSEAHLLRQKLAIDLDFGLRWHLLSHGERKRTQIATALWQAPNVLALDEPTNHIDADARQLLVDALDGFRGIGLLVSHDRALLDRLCESCLWLEPPDARAFAGGFTEASRAREEQQRAAVHERQRASRAFTKLRKETGVRRDKANRANQERSKRGLAPKDADGRSKIDLARASGKDGQAGRLLRQLDGRLSRLKETLDASAVPKTWETGIWLEGEASRRNRVLHVPDGDILAGTQRLGFPTLSVQPTDRIAITGPNGAGKTTLLNHLLQFASISPDRLLFIPQEIAATDARQLIDEIRRLQKEQLGQVLTLVSRLGSRPERLLETVTPSPGETRKLMLALGMLRVPHLIVMDEPTNHMDLASILALETALSDCPCALLLVSHDTDFLQALALINWHINVISPGYCELSINSWHRPQTS
ncbi:MAG: ATP-binding cassette domain-containing protein [Pseudomonadota bacterium]